MRTTRSFRVRPADVGIVGVLDGGTLLEWVHSVAHELAMGWSGRHCVTASFGNFHLDRPIVAGDVVDISADLVYTGTSSIHILVTVCTQPATARQAPQMAQCSIVFVAIDHSDASVEVRQWTPVTMLELQRHRQARVRIRTRKQFESVSAECLTAGTTAAKFSLRLFAAPADHAWGGRVHGGRVMRWMDDAACACAADWVGARVVTSYIAGIRFCRPVFAGDDIELTARVIHTGPRSVHLEVRVTAHASNGAGTRLVAHGVIVVVWIDDRGAARRVRQWEAHTDEDHRLDQYARHLVEFRQFVEPFTTTPALVADAQVAPVA